MSEASDPIASIAGRLNAVSSDMKALKRRKPKSILQKYFYLGETVYILGAVRYFTHSSRFTSFAVQ
jgi:hypothetical protein